MKISILFVFGLFMMVTASVTYAANSGVYNKITLDPGNSLAAHGGLNDGWGDTNCVGDRFSQFARDNNGIGHGANTGDPGGITQVLSDVMTLGSIVRGVFGVDCADWVMP
jgi:hypothetical protein